MIFQHKSDMVLALLETLSILGFGDLGWRFRSALVGKIIAEHAVRPVAARNQPLFAKRLQMPLIGC
ncbi:MAG: hypothetical protein WBE37_00960 [Bryobacteraceae bacterium]